MPTRARALTVGVVAVATIGTGCAHRNVGKHLENACRKLDSHNRHEAAEHARMRELI